MTSDGQLLRVGKLLKYLNNRGDIFLLKGYEYSMKLLVRIVLWWVLLSKKKKKKTHLRSCFIFFPSSSRLLSPPHVSFPTSVTLSAVHPNTLTHISHDTLSHTHTHTHIPSHHQPLVFLSHFYTHTHTHTHLWWPYPPHFLLALINLTIHSSSAPHRRLHPR